MYLDERGYLVLKTIVNNPTITGKEVENTLTLSRKQLSYTIDKINDYLQDNELPKIERLRTGKFIVPVSVLQEYQTEEAVRMNTPYVYSETDRGYLIFLMLICSKEELSIYHFTSQLDISKNTFLTDLKKLEAHLEKYELDILYSRQDGYHLVGSEYAKRDAMISIVRNIMKIPNGKKVILEICGINEEQIKEIKKEISEIEDKLHVHFTDERVSELPYILGLILVRNEKERIIRELPEEFQHVAGTREYSVITEFAKKHNISATTERLFLASQIQISNFHGFYHYESQDEEEILKVSRDTIDEFEKIACVVFKERDALLEALLQHIKPALYRIKYHYHIEQSIKDMVLPQYQSLHMMVRKSIRPFEAYLNAEFPDEELVYITALFGAWLRREGIMNIVNKRKRAVVVCANGVSVSNFLFFTLRELFPEIDFLECLSMREFYKSEIEFDVVFSMVRLETDKIQFVTKPFLDENSKRKLREKVLSELNGVVPHQIDVLDIVAVVEKYVGVVDRDGLINDLRNVLGTPQHNASDNRFSKQKKQVELKDILTKDTIQTCCEVLPWKDAVQKAATPLLQQGDINQGYVDQCIKNIEYDKPFIMVADGVIIVHAGVDDGVNTVCVSMMTMSEKIDINGYMEADVIIVLGTPNTTEHLLMLSQMNDMLEDSNQLNLVKKAKMPEEIVNIISQEKEY